MLDNNAKSMSNKQYFDLFYEKLNVNQCIALYKKGYRNITLLYPDKRESRIPDELSDEDIFDMYESGCLCGLNKDELTSFKFIFEKHKNQRVVDKAVFVVSAFNSDAAIEMLHNENSVQLLLKEYDKNTIFEYMKYFDFSEWALYNVSKLELVSSGVL